MASGTSFEGLLPSSLHSSICFPVVTNNMLEGPFRLSITWCMALGLHSLADQLHCQCASDCVTHFLGIAFIRGVEPL